jgi:hypothetical protein
MSEVQIECRTAGPVNDKCKQDDGKENYHQPEEEHDDPGYGVPGDASLSSHGPQLPGIVRLIPVPGANP